MHLTFIHFWFDLIWFLFYFVLHSDKYGRDGGEKDRKTQPKTFESTVSLEDSKTNQNMLSQVKSSRGVRCWKYNHPLMPEIIICFHHILMYMSILLSVYIDYTKFLHCCLSWCVPSWSSNYKNSLSYNKDPTDSIRENNLVGL